MQEASVERIIGAKEGLTLLRGVRTASVAGGRRSPLPDAATFAGLEAVGSGAGRPRRPAVSRRRPLPAPDASSPAPNFLLAHSKQEGPSPKITVDWIE